MIYLSWLIAIGLFVVYLGVHILLFRLREPKMKFKTLKILFFAMVPVVFLTTHFAVAQNWFALGAISDLSIILSSLGILFFLFIGYCSFYSLVDRSVSVRVNVEFFRTGNQAVTLDKIVDIYGADAANARRVEHLIVGQYIKEVSNGQYDLTSKGLRMAQFVTFVKNLLKLGMGG